MVTKGPSLRLTRKRKVVLAETPLSTIDEAYLPEVTRDLLGTLLADQTVLDLAEKYNSGELEKDYEELAEGNLDFPLVAQMMDITRDALLETFKTLFAQ